MRANFRTTLVDRDYNEWQCEGTVLAETALGGEHPSGAVEELIIDTTIRLLEFERNGRQLYCESLATLPDIFNSKMEQRIEAVAKEALQDAINYYPKPKDFGIKE